MTALPTTYRKLIATQLTKNFREAVQIVAVDMPEPKPDEILVRNLYAGVNASDVNMSAGIYNPGTQPPLDLGFEAVGEVVALGSEVADFNIGDAVITSSTGGGYREYYPVRARFATRIPAPRPEYLSLIVSGVTASVGLHVAGEMKSSETVLVTAAAGGTGQFAVQLAKLAGNHVVGTCGSDDKADLLRALGCDRAINYRREDLRAILQNEYSKGIDLVYECVGGETFDACLDHLAIRGRLVIIGAISEYVGGLETVTRPRVHWHLLTRSASLRGMFLPHFRQHIREHFARLMELYHAGQLKVEIDPAAFRGVESVVDAVEYLHSGRSTGKVMVCL